MRRPQLWIWSDFIPIVPGMEWNRQTQARRELWKGR
jgi:hypothetical protein